MWFKFEAMIDRWHDRMDDGGVNTGPSIFERLNDC